MFGPQTATGGRIRSSIFFSYRVLFGKLRGGPRRIGPLLQSCLLLHKIHNRISRRGGNTWRDGESPGDGRDLERGKKGFFGFGVHKLQIWNHIVPYCLSLSLSSSRVRRAQSGSHTLSLSLPFFLNGVLVTRARSSTALKWKKHQKKQPRVLSFRPAAVSGRRQGCARSMECLKLPINFLKASHCERLHLHPLHQRERRETGKSQADAPLGWGSTSFRHIFVLCHNLIAYSHSIPTKNHAHSIKISRSDPFVLSAHP